MDDFFNTVMAALAEPRRGIDGYKKSKAGEYARNVLRQELLGAQRFTISNALSAEAVKASLAEPKIMAGMMDMAVPPFNNMWIEWDEHHRVTMIHDLYKSLGMQVEGLGKDVSPRVGYHIIQRAESVDVESEKVFDYTMVAMIDKKVFIAPLSLCMCNDDVMTYKAYYGKYRYNPDAGRMPSQEEWVAWQKALGLPCLGYSYMNYRPQVKHIKHFEDMCCRMGFTTSPSITMTFGGDERVTQDAMPKLMEGAKQMYEGDARYLITVLAMLNYPHNIVQRGDVQQASAPRIQFGRRVPRNELRVLEIDLPKPLGTTKYEKMFRGMGSPKRQHVRRGHWHTYIYKDGRRESKWIGEQVVGNPELGRIDHDYLLNRRNG